MGVLDYLPIPLKEEIDAVEFIAGPLFGVADDYEAGKSSEYDDSSVEQAADDAEVRIRAEKREMGMIPYVGRIMGALDDVQDLHAFGSDVFGDGSVPSSDEQLAQSVAIARANAAKEVYAEQATIQYDEGGNPMTVDPDGAPAYEDDPCGVTVDPRVQAE